MGTDEQKLLELQKKHMDRITRHCLSLGVPERIFNPPPGVSEGIRRLIALEEMAHARREQYTRAMMPGLQQMAARAVAAAPLVHEGV